jgi:hypothetical protein
MICEDLDDGFFNGSVLEIGCGAEEKNLNAGGIATNTVSIQINERLARTSGRIIRVD